VLVHFVSAVLIAGGLPAFGQSERPANSEISPYLVRVQRTTPGNTICVLLRHDGQFHLETSHGDRTKVLEGSLPSSELLKVRRMLDSDGLPRLSQDKPDHGTMCLVSPTSDLSPTDRPLPAHYVVPNIPKSTERVDPEKAAQTPMRERERGW
jgi:hypothetical protein